MKMKNTWMASAATSVIAVLSIASHAQTRDLTIVSWGGPYQEAQKEHMFKPFAAATGIKVVDEFWEGGIGVLRTKIQGGSNNWDVVQVEADELGIGCDEGLFEKISPEKVGGKERYLKDALSPCGVGAVIYNVILAYDGDKLKQGPTGWVDFFDTKKFPGKRALRNNPKWNLEIALMADGVGREDVYKVLRTREGEARAFKKLDSIKRDLIFWKTGSQPPQMLAAGDVTMTTAFNARITTAAEQNNRNFKIVWKDAPYTMDSWVIMKGTPDKINAEKLIEFSTRAEPQAQIPKTSRSGPTNLGAFKLIDKRYQSDLPSDPEHFKVAMKEDAKFWIDNFDRISERWNKWAGTK